ncbi:MAG: 2-amino-4-hydroxy-6-hydroxymethyldihydropteridine diphosphokinase [Gammaproteobacteria bacterium]
MPGTKSPRGATHRVRVFVGIGSNVDAERHVCAALHRLGRRFGCLVRSRVYRNAAVGFEGDPFLNLVAGFETDEPVEMVVAALHHIEQLARRRRNAKRNEPRTLDLDLLLYGGGIIDVGGVRVPRAEILTRAYVLGPLAEIAGDVVHPVTGMRIAALWEAFDRGRHALEEVALECDETASGAATGV